MRGPVRHSSERLFLRLDGDPVYAPETEVPAGTLAERPVPAALAGLVSPILICHEEIPAGQEVLERVLPDGAARMIFHLGQTPPRAELVGASASATLLRLSGRLDGLSIKLRTAATQALFGVPARELSERAVPLEELWPGRGRALLDAMIDAGDDATRTDLLAAALRREARDAEHEAGRRAVERAMDLMARCEGRRALRDIAQEIGLGERRLQQLFAAHVGLSPRAWSRLSRLHGCLRALRRAPALPFSRVAIEHGYYDQSHLANEFRAITGLTPRAFFTRPISRSSKTAPSRQRRPLLEEEST
jgi:AraC-like DNA-binding protein